MGRGGGCRDTDLGMEDILKQIKALRHMAVKAGITEKKGEKEVDGVTIAQYAVYNEYGVPSKSGKKLWRIPPRPFITGWAENRTGEIKVIKERHFKNVSEGKMDAEQAINAVGVDAVSGIQRYIMTGSFKENSDVTVNGSKPGKDGKQFIKPKKSNRPLIDTGAMKNAVSYEVVKSGGE